jgi:hypothetical protein
MFGFSVGYGTKLYNTFPARTAQEYGRPGTGRPSTVRAGQQRRITGMLAEKQAYVLNYRLSLAFLPLVRQSRRFSEIMRS